MGEISVGPDNAESEREPAAETRRITSAPPSEVDALNANEADTRHGLAGAEAKLSAQQEIGHSPSVHRPGDSQTAPDEPNDMIAGRRNAGRDDAGDAPPETEERSE